MATPDDLEEFRSCQIGYMGNAAPWNDLSRGATHWIDGPDEAAASIGLNPVLSGAKTEDEGLFRRPAPLLDGHDAQASPRRRTALTPWS